MEYGRESTSTFVTFLPKTSLLEVPECLLQEEPNRFMDAATAFGCCYPILFVKVAARTIRSDSDIERK
jgi:hypothetical protein